MLNKVLAVIAAGGFLVSLVFNVLGWLRIDPPGGHAIFLLHVLCLALWFALVIQAQKKFPNDGRKNIEHLTGHLSKRVRVAGGILFGYAILNFVYFIYCSGQYEKHHVPLYLEIRGFSGHWMLFSGFAAAGFFAMTRLRQKNKKD
jgi:hypothetical protein